MCGFTYSWRNSCCSSVVDEFDSLFNDTTFGKMQAVVGFYEPRGFSLYQA